MYEYATDLIASGIEASLATTGLAIGTTMLFILGGIFVIAGVFILLRKNSVDRP